MSSFAGSRNVPPQGGGQFMDQGLYKVQIKALSWSVSKKPEHAGKKLARCEFTVIESNNPKHAPGSTGLWISLDDVYKKTIANMNALFGAALGDYFKRRGIKPRSPEAMEHIEYFEQAILEPHLDEGVAAAALLKEGMDVADPAAEVIGKVVELECTMIKTKGGGDFTKYCWEPVA